MLSGGVSEVGSVKPVEDFKEMISRRDVDLVDKAIEGLRKRTIDMVSDSYLDQLYPKAIECVKVLREGCIKEEESEQFNRFLREARALFEGKRRDDFWKLIVNRKISLIHYDESEESSVSPAEAEQFLQGPVVVLLEPKINVQKDDSEVDDLLAMVE